MKSESRFGPSWQMAKDLKKRKWQEVCDKFYRVIFYSKWNLAEILPFNTTCCPPYNEYPVTKCSCETTWGNFLTIVQIGRILNVSDSKTQSRVRQFESSKLNSDVPLRNFFGIFLNPLSPPTDSRDWGEGESWSMSF